MMARFLQFSPAVVGMVTVAVIVGHIWPAWFHFHGGKGIATSMGAFGALQIKLLIIGGTVLLIAYLLTRRFPLSWVLSLISMPVIAYLLDYPGNVTVPLLVSAGVILIAHKDNIKKAVLTQVHKA